MSSCVGQKIALSDFCCFIAASRPLQGGGKLALSDFCCFIAASWSYSGRGKLALSDLHEAAMKQHEALHIQGEQKLQSRIINEAAVKQQFFSNAASSLLRANPRVQLFPSQSMTMKQQ